MTTIVRGATVIFSATFTDANGNPFTPASVDLYVNYVNANRSRQSVVTPMTNGAGTWTASWESAVAPAGGVVYYSIRTTGSPQIVAKDGQFTLAANPANPT
jgi:hypothetical protein